MDSIDLNADLGESFGAWKMGNDEDMLDIVSSANIACGFHAGDPEVMLHSVQQCIAKGVNIGAHPGFDDLRGFGRRRIANLDFNSLRADVIYQVAALAGIAQSCAGQLTHVKMHGALGNLCSEQEAIASCCLRAVNDYSDKLTIVAIAATWLQSVGEQMSMPLAREIYADRGYNDDGTLVARGTAGAMIHDPIEAGERVLRILDSGELLSINGKRVAVSPQTVCVHGDSDGAVEMAETLRATLEKAGVAVVGFC